MKSYLPILCDCVPPIEAYLFKEIEEPLDRQVPTWRSAYFKLSR